MRDTEDIKHTLSSQEISYLEKEDTPMGDGPWTTEAKYESSELSMGWNAQERFLRRDAVEAERGVTVQCVL